MGLDDYMKEKAVGASRPIVEPVAAPEVEPAQVPAVEPAPAPAPDPQPAPTPAPDPQPAPTPQFDINNFNSFFETPFKGESEIRDVISNASKYQDIQQRNVELEAAKKSLEEKNKELQAGADPLSYFSSEDAYIAEQIKKRLPEVDPGVMAKLLSQDRSNMADFDLLAYDWLRKYPNTKGGLDGARKVVAKKYGVELDDPAEEWDDVAQNMMMADARDVGREIDRLKGEIPLPRALTPEEREAQRVEAVNKMRASWAPYTNDIAGFDKLTVPGDDGSVMLEMEIPQAFRESLPEYINGIIEKTGLEPTPESLKEVIDYRNRTFVYEYLPKILEVYGSNIRSEIEKKYNIELNNQTPPNNVQAPPSAEPQPGASFRQHIAGRKGR